MLIKFKFNEALGLVWEIIGFCDKYINEEKLWETRNPQVINDLFFAIKEIGTLLEPFLPETAEKIKKIVDSQKSRPFGARLAQPSGVAAENLFPKIIK